MVALLLRLCGLHPLDSSGSTIDRDTMPPAAQRRACTETTTPA